MDEKIFDEIKESMGQAVNIVKGKEKPSRVFEFNPKVVVKALHGGK